MDEFVTLLTVAAFIGIGVASAVAVALWRDRVGTRREELEVAKVLFDRHFVAANKLLDDPATPAGVRDFIVTFATILRRDDIAPFVMEALADRGPIPADSRPLPKVMRNALEEARQMATHRPDLGEAFSEFAMTGMLGTVLRADERLRNLPRAVIAATPAKPGEEVKAITRFGSSIRSDWCPALAA